MEIPNYDSNSEKLNNYKRIYKYMPDDTFRMLICGGRHKVKQICFITC